MTSRRAIALASLALGVGCAPDPDAVPGKEPEALSCPPGWGDCDDDAENGCETDLLQSSGNCGACGFVCAAPGFCEAGACAASRCEAGVTGERAGCGASGDCCASAVVTGGTFMMGRSATGTDAFAGGDVDELSEHEATVTTFELDTFEVTVGRFRRFVNEGASTQQSPPQAGAGKNPRLPADSGWEAAWATNLEETPAALGAALACHQLYATWTGQAGENETLPINCITWYEAFAFCAWDGGRLPTEAEWEYATAGGSDNRYYPWSVPPSSTSLDETYALYDNCGGAVCTGLEGILTVGSKSPKGDGAFEQADLGGSMWEWSRDVYELGWYDGDGKSCVDCSNLTGGSSRVIRGGSWQSTTADRLRTTERSSLVDVLRREEVGFRCARDRL